MPAETALPAPPPDVEEPVAVLAGAPVERPPSVPHADIHQVVTSKAPTQTAGRKDERTIS